MTPPHDAGHTTLGKGCQITGKLTFDGTVHVDGQVEGEIEAKDTVVVGDTAIVKAQVTADAVVITGKVTGDVTARRRLELKAPAQVHGNITTPSLIVHDGVVFEGRCSMNGSTRKVDTPVVPPPGKKRPAADIPGAPPPSKGLAGCQGSAA